MKTAQLSLKIQFKQWVEEEKKTDEMIAIATIPHILKRFERRLAIVKGNRIEKCYQYNVVFSLQQHHLIV